MPMDTDDSGNIEVLKMGDEQANPVNPKADLSKEAQNMNIGNNGRSQYPKSPNFATPANT